MKPDDNRNRMIIVVLMVMFSCFYSVKAFSEQSTLQDYGQKQSNTESRSFSIHDINQDGFLDKEEYDIFLYRMKYHRQSNKHPYYRYKQPFIFSQIDQNSDGLLDEDEMTSAMMMQLREQGAIVIDVGGD